MIWPLGQLENAIGTLCGQTASTFTLAESTRSYRPPQIPMAMTSDLLERRPDVAQAERNAKRNGLAAKVKFVHADVFEHLRGLRGALPELVVVDPAKQAASRDEVQRALGYYRDLNALVYEKAAEGALVLSCSCTGLVSESAFLDVLAQAAVGARRNVTFLEVHGAPAQRVCAACVKTLEHSGTGPSGRSAAPIEAVRIRNRHRIRKDTAHTLARWHEH